MVTLGLQRCCGNTSYIPVQYPLTVQHRSFASQGLPSVILWYLDSKYAGNLEWRNVVAVQTRHTLICMISIDLLRKNYFKTIWKKTKGQ
jgi:hypothetical protein